MPLYKAISTLKKINSFSEEDVSQFMEQLPPATQEKLIRAIYLGRDLINQTEFNLGCETQPRGQSPEKAQDAKTSAYIIIDKHQNVLTYLDRLENLANQAGYDLNNL